MVGPLKETPHGNKLRNRCYRI